MRLRCNGIRFVALAAVTAAWLVSAGCGKPDAPAGRPGMGVPEVATVTVRPERVVLSTGLPGRVSALRVADIRPQVSGLILKRLFTEGSDVKAGQPLYQIDPVPLRAALDGAEAALARAEAALPSARLREERFGKLAPDRAVSRQDYDDAVAARKQAEAEVESWKAQVETARINLGYAQVTAPISGRIGKSGVTEGAVVTAYQPLPLATVQQLDPIYVDLPQSTADMLRLKRRLDDGRLEHEGPGGDEVRLILEDGREYPRAGTLKFRDVTVDPTTGSVILRAVFPNPEGVLLPGMFVRAVVREGVKQQAILVPQQGVSRDPRGNPYALVVDNENKAAFRPLVLDRAIGDRWLVSSGLAPGDRVIVEGLMMLRPGTVVKASPFDPARAGAVPGAGPQKRGEGGR